MSFVRVFEIKFRGVLNLNTSSDYWWVGGQKNLQNKCCFYVKKNNLLHNIV